MLSKHTSMAAECGTNLDAGGGVVLSLGWFPGPHSVSVVGVPGLMRHVHFLNLILMSKIFENAAMIEYLCTHMHIHRSYVVS